MSKETVDNDTPRERGGLTGTDREYLRKSERERQEEYSRQARSAARSRIRKRVRASLRDFRLLADELPSEERDKIFSNEPRTDEFRELQEDIAKTIEFLYTGLKGASGFRQPLQQGVANGELELGYADNLFETTVQFSVDRAYLADHREIADLIEAEEWDRLHPRDLFSFIRLAFSRDAIDFDSIREWLEFRDWGAQFVGKKRRAFPGGKQTPLMDPEVYDREGIGEMSPEELRDLFGEGYGHGTHVIYDGEKVYAPSPPGSDDTDPEVLDWVDDESKQDTDEE